MRWLDLVERDPVPWLLDPANPSARALTLRDVFHRSGPALQAEFDRLLDWPPIRALRAHWNRLNFWGRSTMPYYGSSMGNFGTLYLLAQLGVPRFDEVEPVCESLLQHGRRDDGRFAPAFATGAPWLCYTGMALQVMWHFGFGDDLRTRSAWAAMIQAILLRPELLACSIAGGMCFHGLVKALAALLSAPPEQRSADDQEAIEVLSERLINHPFDFEGDDAPWLQWTFPRYYNSDLIEYCHVMAQTPYRAHHRLEQLVRRLMTFQTEQGRWRKMEATPVLPEERIYHPSRWLTYEVVHVLVLTYGDDVYAT
jgi:hypothetical protein